MLLSRNCFQLNEWKKIVYSLFSISDRHFFLSPPQSRRKNFSNIYSLLKRSNSTSESPFNSDIRLFLFTSNFSYSPVIDCLYQNVCRKTKWVIKQNPIWCLWKIVEFFFLNAFSLTFYRRKYTKKKKLFCVIVKINISVDVCGGLLFSEVICIDVLWNRM